MTAGVWCPEHDLRKTIVHPLTEIDPVTQEVCSSITWLMSDCFNDICIDV